jgi:hypothetical protein
VGVLVVLIHCIASFLLGFWKLDVESFNECVAPVLVLLIAGVGGVDCGGG